MALDDFKSLVDIPLHVLIIDEVLFELLGQLAAKCLDSINLFGDSLADFHDLLIYVPRKEVSPFSRVLRSLLDLFTKLLRQRLRVVSDRGQLLHDIFD